MSEDIDYGIFVKLFSRTSKVLFAYDVDAASITYLNAAFSHLWNRRRESVMDNPGILLETIHPEDMDYLVKEYDELLSGTSKHEIEFRILLPDSSEMWLLLTPQLITDSKGKRIIAGIVEDITVAKDNIANLQKFASKKNSVLEILSHELSGPIANVHALAELLMDYTSEYKNSELDNVIRIIKESSDKSIRLIREFVQQEFLESAYSGMVKRRVNLVEKVREMMDQYKDGEVLINKDFRFNSSSDTIYINIDQNKFLQVLNNLISNSIKFTHDKGIIALDIFERETTVLITIKDDGIGIPQRFHKELFEKFSPARREGLKGEPSTGLGMSIIKTIVEWHKGNIWFESEENAGSTFYIEIPKE
ncbi:ATP-binding protein [Pontibacter toksunensis]|uniref:histidine kinase n=1 Tax=Pontibacter toksunensis TaxID=1332631 RepID=A0ABW6BVZ1_9BACT